MTATPGEAPGATSMLSTQGTMAPYLGPNLAQTLAALRRGETEITLGLGVPQAIVRRRGSVLVLEELSVVLSPAVTSEPMGTLHDGPELFRADTWLALAAALIERWDRNRYGEAFRADQGLDLRFAPGPAGERALHLALRRNLGLGLTDALALARAGHCRTRDLTRARAVLAAVAEAGVLLDV